MDNLIHQQADNARRDASDLRAYLYIYGAMALGMLIIAAAIVGATS